MADQSLRNSASQICPHCELAAEPATERPLGGPNGVTEAAIQRGSRLMAKMDPERTPQQHEWYVRNVVQGIREHLVQRHLYDAIVRQYNQPRKPA